MDNINMLLPNLPSTNESKDIKTDKPKVKVSENNLRESNNTFDKQLSKAKGKELKVTKSIIKDNVKELLGNKAIDIKKLSEDDNIEAIYNAILTLINNIMEVPMEDIENILQEMNIAPTDLLNQETFKEFLAHMYPGDNELELLFNEDKSKDISKLFTKLEQISTFIQGEQNHVLIEKWVLQDEVVKTSVTEIKLQPSNEHEMIPNEQIITQVAQPKESLGTPKGNQKEEAVSDGSLSEEGLLNFKQMGLGINVPIQALNTTIGTKFWDAHMTQSNNNSSLLHNDSITHQMISKLDITSVGKSKEITMELSPKELGNLSIKLVETNGSLVAHIRVETEKTKQLLLSEIAQLKEGLEGQGISISEVKVDIRQNAHQEQMEQQKQKSTKRIQELIDQHLIEVQEEAEQQFDERTGERIETEVNYMV